MGAGPPPAARDRASNPRTASPGCSSCSTRNGPPRSAASPWTTFTPTNSSHGSGSAANPSCCPNPSPPSSASSSPPAADTPPSATGETRRWLFPGGRPGQPISAAHLAERLRQTRAPPRTSPLQRAVPPRHRTPRGPARPTARHQHQRRRRLATRQQPETGPTTPPTTAAAATRTTSPNLRTMIVRESYSESSNIRLRQNTPTWRRKNEPSPGSPRRAHDPAATDPPIRCSPSSNSCSYADPINRIPLRHKPSGSSIGITATSA